MIEYEQYKQKIAALEPMFEELERGLNLASVKKELQELEEQSNQDGFWNDLQASQTVLKQTKSLQNKLAEFNRFKQSYEDLSTLCMLALEENDESFLAEITLSYNTLLNNLENARLATLLSGEFDDNNAIVSFHAGAGGTESQDWAEMLLRMYMRWADRHDFNCKIVDYLDGDEAGLKSAVLLIEGENAFGYLKSEHGVHRLVRISPFDSSGRRHTSFAAIEVAPEISDDVPLEIRKEDLKEDTYRSGGAGGQHVNKTESAIRITHKPTGIVVACQNERSQHQNREIAMRMLRSKLIEIKERQHLDKIDDIKGDQKAIEWGSQIRSYVFMPYTLTKDHRTGFESGNINAVMDGEIDGFISAFLTASATGVWATK